MVWSWAFCWGSFYHRKSGRAWGLRPAVCRQTQIVFLWLWVNQWGEGILWPGLPGRPPLPSPGPSSAAARSLLLSRPEEAAVLPQPSPVFEIEALLVPALVNLPAANKRGAGPVGRRQNPVSSSSTSKFPSQCMTLD